MVETPLLQGFRNRATEKLADIPGLRRLRRLQTLSGYLFILPWVLGFLIFKLAPLVASFIISLTDFFMLEPRKAQFVGLANYLNVFSDTKAVETLSTSITFALISITLQVGCATLLATILTSQRLRTRPILRSLIFLPSIIPAVAVVFMWRGFFNYTNGLFNPILEFFGLPALVNLGRFSRFADSNLMRAIQALWGIGPGFLIMYGAIQGVPLELYESAKLDGAGPLRQFFNITLPLASPAIFFSLIINLVTSFGGVALLDRGTTYSGGLSPYDDYISLTMFTYFRVGYATSLAWVFFGMIFLVTALLFISARWWVYYPDGN